MAGVDSVEFCPSHFTASKIMEHHIARNGQQLGVFAAEEIQSGIDSGRFLLGDLFWTEGMAEWQELRTKYHASAGLQSQAGTSFNPYAAPKSEITPPGIGQGLRLASRGSRLGASIIDTLILVIVLSVPICIGVILMGQAEKAGVESVPGSALAFFIAAAVGTLALLVWNAVWLTRYGQTIAKRLLKIRIVSFPDGQNAGFAKAFMLRALVNFIIAQFVPLYGLVDACFIFRKDQRCLHDLIADTTVVECERDA